MYAERVRDLEWYLGVDTPPQTPDGESTSNSNNGGSKVTNGEAKMGGGNAGSNTEAEKPNGTSQSQASGTLQLVKVKNS
jgi:hypothetical protein